MQAIKIVQRQANGQRDDGRAERCPECPLVSGADAEPGQGNDRHAQRNDETTESYLHMTDIVIDLGTESGDLIRGAAHMLRCESDFDEAGKVPNKEEYAVAD